MMKKIIIAFFSLTVLFNLSGITFAQTPNTTATPITIPTRAHAPNVEIQRHVYAQYKRIKKALDAKIITPEQAKTLHDQAGLADKKWESDFQQNKEHRLKKDQENQIYQMLNNSARAIDKAIGASTDPS